MIQDSNTGNRATVTKFGQLVVAPVDYSVPNTIKLDTINTAFNFIAPIYQKSIIITDIIVTANKNVGANDATVNIFEADSTTSITSTKDIISLEMLKKTTLPLNGLNMIVSDGKFVNATTDDNDVFITIMYYYVPVKLV